MLVLCCGHPDRGDDACGPRVAQCLRDKGIEAREADGGVLELIEAWRGADDVVLVDAMISGRRPGAVSVWNALATRFAGRTRIGSSHALGLPEAIALSRTLGWLPRRLTLYGIEARSFEWGQPPSRAVLRGIERAAQRVYEYCVDPRGPAV